MATPANATPAPTRRVSAAKAAATAAPAPGQAAPARGQRKVREGMVVSDRMQKTIVVRISRLVRHAKYARVLERQNTFKVHDETNSAKTGDMVRIMETRPLSKDKRWRLVEILRRASTAPPVPGTEPALAAKPPAPETAG